MEDTLSTDNLSKCCNHIRINIASIMSMERINESFGTVISCKRYPILAGYIIVNLQRKRWTSLSTNLTIKNHESIVKLVPAI